LRRSTVAIAFESTANNGAVTLDRVSGGGATTADTDLDFDVGDAALSFGFLGMDRETFTVLYRSAAGTTVTGELLAVRGAAAATCLVTGTLFVG
jgi:hypothetical protein